MGDDESKPKLDRVSVVVCTRNSRRLLEDCLASLLAQDHGHREIIVVDDASEDDTAEWLGRVASGGRERLIVVTNPSRLGVAGSRNAGISRATGDVIAFTDADCVVERRWISELLRGYALSDASAVGGSIAGGRPGSIWGLLDRRHNFVASEEGLVSYIQGCNMSFRADVLAGRGFNAEIQYGFEETLLCDELVAQGHRIYYRPQAVVHHLPRDTFRALWQLKFRRGLSSVWYRKKRRMFPLYKRHFVLLMSILCLPLSLVHGCFSWISAALFGVFLASLLRDEVLFRTNSNVDVVRSLPFLVLIEFSHFWGSLVGLYRFRILPGVRRTPVSAAP